MSPLGLSYPLLISIGLLIIGALLLPRGVQSYRNTSDLRFLGGLAMLGIGVDLVLQIIELGKPSMAVGLVIGALVVRLAERSEQR